MIYTRHLFYKNTAFNSHIDSAEIGNTIGLLFRSWNNRKKNTFSHK